MRVRERRVHRDCRWARQEQTKASIYISSAHKFNLQPDLSLFRRFPFVFISLQHCFSSYYNFKSFYKYIFPSLLIIFFLLLFLFLSIWFVCFHFASTFDMISLAVAKVTRLVFIQRRRNVPRPLPAVPQLSSGRWHMQSMCSSSSSYPLVAVGDCQLPGRKCCHLPISLTHSLSLSICVPHQLHAHVTCITLQRVGMPQRSSVTGWQ